MAAVFRIVNPAQRRKPKRNPALYIINGGRRKKNMATAKKKYSRPRARPKARPRAKARVNTRRPRQYARARVHHNRRRRTNPVHRRRRAVARANPRRHRRRNPGMLGSVTGIFEGALTAIIGMGVTDYATGLISGFLPTGGNPIFGIGIKLGVAWGVGELAKKFGFARHAQLLAIGGAVSAGKDALSLAFGGGGILFPSAPATQVVQTAPGQALIPASMTGDNVGVSEIAYAPAGMSEIAFAPAYPGAW